MNFPAQNLYFCPNINNNLPLKFEFLGKNRTFGTVRSFNNFFIIVNSFVLHFYRAQKIGCHMQLEAYLKVLKFIKSNTNWSCPLENIPRRFWRILLSAFQISSFRKIVQGFCFLFLQFLKAWFEIQFADDANPISRFPRILVTFDMQQMLHLISTLVKLCDRCHSGY